MIKTFISHSSSDHQFVEWLKTKLERENIGLDIFVDDGAVIVGDNPQMMIDEVKKSIIFIPIFSNESVKKEFVQNEIRTAIYSETTHIFPVKLKCDDRNIPEEFKTKFSAFDKVEGKIYEDFSEEKEWDIHYENLRKAIFNKIVEIGLLKEDTKDFYQDCEHLDLILQRDDPTILEIKTVIDIYLKKEPYQRYLFSKLTNLKWLKYLKLYGYLTTNPQPIEVENSPGSFIIPQWYPLEYLEKVSKQIGSNEEAINDLLEIIKSVTNLKDAYGQHIDNYRTWHYFVKILLNLPNDKIPPDVIELIPTWLDSKFDTTLQGADIATELLPKFLPESPTSEDIQKAERVIECITAIKTIPLSPERAKILGTKEESRLAINPYWLKEVFDKCSETIGDKCSKKVIEHLAKKIRALLKREEGGTYQSFYEEPKYSSDEPLEILTHIFKRILLAKAKSDVATTTNVLRYFLNDKEHLYFPKMALYVMGQNIDNYSQLFHEILDTEICSRIMANKLYLGDELKYVLQNLKDLSHEEMAKLNKNIEESAESHSFEEDRERHIAHYKQQIYQALSHYSYFKSLCEEMKKITGTDAKLHPAIGKVEISHGEGPPPFTKEEIMQISNDKLAEYLSTFKTIDYWRGPSVGGLAEVLAEVAKEMPDKFTKELSAFKDTGFIYVYEIFKGIREAWNSKKSVDWAKLFKFMELYINKKEFWDDKFIVEKGEGEWLGGADHQWIVGIVAELIEDGTRDDAWAFSEEHFEDAEKIIFYLLDNIKHEEEKEISDYVTHTLNTPCGKLITALIYLALRISRVNNKKGIPNDPRWSKKYKGKFNELLDSKNIEAYTSVGRYLPNLSYLDKRWLGERIEILSSEKGGKYWEAFMDGYLSIGKVYKDIYSVMRPHYQYGLTYDFKEKRNKEHLVQHICVGYLQGDETLDPDSLFRKIIDTWEADQIREIIGFFWMQRAYLKISSEENEKIKTRIIDFWRKLYEKYNAKDEGSLTKEDKKVLSSVSKLTALLPEINSEFCKLIMLSARYAHEDFNSPFFIEHLDELKDKGEPREAAKYLGKIYLKMLEKSTPDYDQKYIRSIVEFLYSADANDSANKICNIYGSKGYEFLRDIYDKYSH